MTSDHLPGISVVGRRHSGDIIIIITIIILYTSVYLVIIYNIIIN